MKITALAGALALATISGMAVAQETTTYTYDALGRVQKATKTGGPASNEATTYTYDAAGNRSNIAISGSTGSGGSSGGSGSAGNAELPGVVGVGGASYIVVVPLNGFTLIIGN